MPYVFNEANGRVVNISDAKNPKNGDRMMEAAMNTPTRSFKDAEGNWKSRGFRLATPAEIKAHQKKEREDAAQRAQVVAERKQRNAGMQINSIDTDSLVKAISGNGEKAASKGAKTDA